MNDHMPSLARLAQGARERPTLLAGLLFAYQQQEGLDEQKLAAFLGCDDAALPKLALCRRPRQQIPAFREDIERIAQYAGVNPLSLMKLVRAVETRAALQHAADVPPPLLLAARDHDEAPDEDPDDEEPSDG
ncbi:MAG TPA: hypothetical protein VKT82_16465 [Ktedonobacterales bacterium]|nr:hypothetical protein [Ktedonobacterales bacterium]